MILTTEHERWSEFLERLEGPEGCDFTQSDPDDALSARWECSPLSVPSSKARHVLTLMGGIDVEGTLEWVKATGNHCDCEIIFNLKPFDEEED